MGRAWDGGGGGKGWRWMILWGEKRECLRQTPDLGVTTAPVPRLRNPRLVATVTSLLIFLLPEVCVVGKS